MSLWVERDNALEDLLRRAFQSDSSVDHVILRTSTGVTAALRGAFTAVPLSAPNETGEPVIAWVCSKHALLSIACIRPARVEDHDDLTAVVAQQAPAEAASQLGHYVLAKLIDLSDDEHKTIVVEGPDGRAVGCVMATRDVTPLSDVFNLSDFGYLKKETPSEKRKALSDAAAAAEQCEDWAQVASAHADKIETLLHQLAEPCAVGSDGISVNLEDAASALNVKGDAWGYYGPGGLRLGDALLLRCGRYHSDIDAQAGVAAVNQLLDDITATSSTTPASRSRAQAADRFIALSSISHSLASEEVAGKAAGSLLQLPVANVTSLVAAASAEQAAAAEAERRERARKAEEVLAKRGGGGGGKALTSAAVPNSGSALSATPAFRESHGGGFRDSQSSAPAEASAASAAAAAFASPADQAQLLVKQLSKPQYAKGALLIGWPADREALQAALAARGIRLAISLEVCDNEAAVDFNSDEDTEATRSAARLRQLVSFRDASAASPPVCLVEGAPRRLRARQRRVAVSAGIEAAESSETSEEEAMKEAMRPLLTRHGLLAPLSEVRSPAASFMVETASADSSNAFGITLFALDTAYHSRVDDLLAAAFDAFHDRQYAVFLQPCAAPHAYFLRRFSQAAPIHVSSFDYSLFICRRESLLPALMTVRRATEDDRHSVRQLLLRSPGGLAGDAMDTFAASEAYCDLPLAHEEDDSAVAAPPLATFVAILGEQVIGAACLSRNDAGVPGIAAIKLAYDAPELQQHRHDQSSSTDLPTARPCAALTHVAMHPSYSQHARRFLQAATAQFSGAVNQAPLLLYRWRSEDSEEASTLPSVVLDNMQPLARRRLPASLCPQQPSTSDDATDVSKLSDPYRLRHSLYALGPEPVDGRTLLSHRIVVVGASDTALSFISSLIHSRQHRVPHIILVSAAQPGVSGETSALASPLSWDSVRPHLLASLTGTVTAIDRQAQQVALSDGTSVPYDSLVLTPGLQEDTWRRIGLPSPAALPMGVQSVPAVGAYAASLLTQQIEAVAAAAADPEAPVNDVIVYGSSLAALSTVQQLIASGLPPNMVVLVEPPPRVTSADEEMVVTSGALRSLLPSAVDSIGARSSSAPTPASTFTSQYLHEVLTSQGVKVLSGSLVSVRAGPRRPSTTGNYAASSSGRSNATPGAETMVPELVAQFTLASSGGHRRRRSSAGAAAALFGEGAGAGQGTTKFSASLLICADGRQVDASIAAAANESGLVFDGRLVVDHCFRTNDPAVFAGGPAAKFSRRYQTSLSMEKVDSTEAGQALAQGLLSSLTDSGIDALEADSGPGLYKLLPSFSRPKTQLVSLPGGLSYLRSAVPAATPSLLPAKTQSAAGSTVVELVSCVISPVTDGADQPELHAGCCGGAGAGYDKGHAPVARRWRLMLDANSRLVELEFCGQDSSLLGGGFLHDAAHLPGMHASYFSLDATSVAATAEAGDLTEQLRAPWSAALLLDTSHRKQLQFTSAVSAKQTSWLNSSTTTGSNGSHRSLSSTSTVSSGSTAVRRGRRTSIDRAETPDDIRALVARHHASHAPLPKDANPRLVEAIAREEGRAIAAAARAASAKRHEMFADIDAATAAAATTRRFAAEHASLLPMYAVDGSRARC